MIKIGNAPCSWGVLEFESLGDQPHADYDQMLAEMAATGYVGVELGDWGFLPTDPLVLKPVLQQYRLALNSSFVEVALADPDEHEAGLERALQRARLLTAVGDPDPFVVLAAKNGIDPVRTKFADRIQPEHGLSPAQWQIFATGAERIARVVREETGVRTVFHHHCAGFVETPAEVAMLLSLTDPTLLGLCFDTGHWRFAGGDPLAGLVHYFDRIWLVHFKDCHPVIAARSRREEWDYFRSVGHGVFCELGQGEIDFATITAFLRQRGYEGWIVVEQDVLPGMGQPKDSARRNRLFLQSIGL